MKKENNNTNINTNIKNQEEKVMKKEMIIDMVESTYEIVGKARTISNCTGIDESKEEEFLGREDRAVMAAEYIFGHSETEESENEKLLVDYYKNQPEEFFESWTDNDIAGEGLVERMAKDLLSAKANAPEFDKSDRMKLNIQDMYGVKLYRAEFLHTYRKLDARDDVMEDYLTNFLTSYMTWHSLMIQTNGYIKRSFDENFAGIKKYWLCLPISAQCSCSMTETHWIPWDADKKDIWVKPMPDSQYVINESNCPYTFKKGTYGRDAKKEFTTWFSSKYGKTAVLIGIRCDESLSRLSTITSQHRTYMYKNTRYTTRINDNTFNAYPIYDWTTEDIWIANAKFGYDYNKVYDLMYQSGLSLAQMRIASPFHSCGQSNLKLYRALSPNIWGKMISRVNGVNFMGIYGGTSATGYKNIKKPDWFTWKEYAEFLLKTLPDDIRKRFEENIARFEKSWSEKGYGRNPDVIRQMESEGIEIENTHKTSKLCTKPGLYEIVKIKNGIPDDTGISDFRHCPSWKAICITILKNDFTLQYMGVSKSKKDAEKRRKAIEKYQGVL